MAEGLRAFIVSAHPESNSFQAALRTVAMEELAEQGFELQVSDLYAMDFKAVLSYEDFSEPHDTSRLNVSLEQRHAWQHGTLSRDAASELDRLLAADLLLLMFPLWWFGPPAILKGWIDRVFISGAVYGRTAVYEQGRLRGKRALLGVSTGAPAHAYGPHALNGDMNDILMPLNRGVLGFTGMTVLPSYVAYHVPYVGHEGRTKLLEAWRNHLRRLDHMTPLPMPRLSDYPSALGAGERAH